MFEKIQRKLQNFYMFYDLTKMYTKIPDDFTDVVKIREKRIQKLMKKAYKMPFYKERFDKAGVKPEDIKTPEDFVKLPVITKDELREWMNKEINNPKYKDWIIDTTSGSTGQPLSILLSPKEKAFMKANWVRVMMLTGYNPFTGKTVSRINAHDEKPGGQDGFIQKFGILRREFVNQYAPEAEVIDAINKAEPDFLYMNKTEMMRLVLYSERTGKKIFKPKYYDPISEKVDENNRKLFKKVLGPGIIDSYGSAETGACMLRLPDSDEYVVHNDFFVVNVIDDDGNLADEGRIVITPLYKTDLPLINYSIGDKVTSEVRNGVRYIKTVEGRMNDFFRYENGDVTSFFEVTPIIAHCNDIFQIRFIQESYNLIRIQCVHNKAESDMTEAQLEEFLTKELNAVFKKPFAFKFEWMQSIPPDKNGKLRMIVCNVN